MNIPVTIKVEELWGGTEFTKNDWGTINFLVGPNGTGKTRFAEKLKNALARSGFKPRYLAAERLLGLERHDNIWGYLALHCALLFGLGIRLLRILRVLHPPSPRLATLVAETSARMGISVRAVSELSSPIAAAFALVTTRELAFTTKLLALAPDEEVKAICAHELGHLSEARGVLAVRIIGSFIILPLLFIRPAYASSGTEGVVALIAATCLLWVGRVQLTRKMEKRADRIAVDHTVEPGIYARALERLHEANQMPAVLRDHALQTHPDLYDRMVAANATPGYPRPLPPRSAAWSSWVVLAAAVVLALQIFGGAEG